MKYIFRRFYALFFALLLAACQGTNSAESVTTTTTYTHQGMTFQVVEYNDDKVRNVTMYKMVDGGQEITGFYTIGPDGAKTGESGSERIIAAVINEGVKVSKPRTTRGDKLGSNRTTPSPEPFTQDGGLGGGDGGY